MLNHYYHHTGSSQTIVTRVSSCVIAQGLLQINFQAHYLNIMERGKRKKKKLTNLHAPFSMELDFRFRVGYHFIQSS